MRALHLASAALIAAALGTQAVRASASAQATADRQQTPPPICRVQVDAIEIDAFVTDAQGNPVTDLTIDDFERQHGFRVLVELALPPGRYQLRAAAGHVNGATAGSVMADVVVPDFTQAPLAMSHVAVTSRSAGDFVTAAPRALALAAALPAPPTARREFNRGDALTVYAEAYENLKSRAAHTVTLKAELRTDEGRVVQSIGEDRSSKELEGRSGGYGFRADIPLDVEPGIYVVHVEARANVKDQPTVSRDIQIRVK